MIPLFTPRGTEVVCIDDSINPARGVKTLVAGQIYEIAGWCLAKEADGSMVINVEIVGKISDEWAYRPKRFRLLQIPEELTDLLSEQNKDLAAQTGKAETEAEA